MNFQYHSDGGFWLGDRLFTEQYGHDDGKPWKCETCGQKEDFDENGDCVVPIYGCSNGSGELICKACALKKALA